VNSELMNEINEIQQLYLSDPYAVTYQKVNDKIVKVICKDQHRSFSLSQEAAVDAIKNVRAGRASFATQEAYEKYLARYENAMTFMGWKIPDDGQPKPEEHVELVSDTIIRSMDYRSGNVELSLDSDVDDA